MKLKSKEEIKYFQNAIDKCKNEVWLMNQNSKYNLKSALSQIVAIGRVVGGDETLELYASTKEDESYLMEMFFAHPEMI